MIKRPVLTRGSHADSAPVFTNQFKRWFTVVIFSVLFTNIGTLIFEKKPGNFSKRWFYTSFEQSRKRKFGSSRPFFGESNNLYEGLPIKFQVLGYQHIKGFIYGQLTFMLHYRNLRDRILNKKVVSKFKFYLRVIKTQLLINI